MATAQDVVIVGGGLAGLAAATRATELGLRATVLEAGQDSEYMCNSRITGGVFHVGMLNILVDPPEARSYIENATHGYADPALADTLAQNARRAVDWLRTQGIRFIKAGPAPDMNAVLAPPKLQQFGLHWKGRGGDVLLRTLGERINARGGTILRGTRARELVLRDERCVGVRAERDGKVETFEAAAVVIADGGFQANRDLVRRYISPAPDRVRQRNTETGRGDGLLMAEAIGAKLTGLDRFYGHVLHREAMSNERLWPYPMLDALPVAGIAVDGAGRRFADEGLGGIYIANAIAALDDPLVVTVLFDDAVWKGPARDGVLSPNPNLAVAGGSMMKAATLDGLAAMAGLPVERLRQTVASYNDAVEHGRTGTLDPPRSVGVNEAFPIRVPPFYAVPVCAGLTYTMGGIHIDGQARVLRPDGSVIRGLYAAGAATGGLEGGPFAGYTGGLSKASVFGLIAGESIAATPRTGPGVA